MDRAVQENGTPIRLQTVIRNIVPLVKRAWNAQDVIEMSVVKQPASADTPLPAKSAAARSVRADAQRNLDALLEAAKAVFASSGVDAPVREVATRAGVGVATVYRHFPQRADLIAAVFPREVDAQRRRRSA